MWLTIAAVLLIGGLVVVLAFRAEKSAANGALAILTLVAVVTSAILLARGSGATRSATSIAETRQPAQLTASLPALSCLDGIAGESVESACEKAIFSSAESVAAAVSYSAAQISRLASFGKVATANKAMTPELNALRRTVERDRFGMIAHVLMTREGCTLSVCPFFASLTNTARISLNMNERLYDGFIGNYAPAWNAPIASAPAITSPVAALPPTAPTGKPVSGDFPTAASIPPVNIMTPEPAAQGSAQSPSPNARAPDSSPASARAQTPPQAPKKSAAQKSRAQAPTSLAPSQADDDN